MIRHFLLITGWVLMLAGSSALAVGDRIAGEEKAVTCQACHGPAGAKSVTPDIPVLAGQHQDYLEHTLKAYRSGDRQQAVMSAFAQQLNDQDIADLAAYFSSQDAALRTAKSGD